MRKEIDITGLKFGKLTAIKKEKSIIQGNQKRQVWLFRCDCGEYIKTHKYSVISGRTLQCKKCSYKIRAKKNKTHGMGSKVNGSFPRLYQCWLDMRNRCKLKTRKCYNSYGGRGIRVCDEWDKSFISFRDWSLKNGYSEKLTIDRIDVNGNYEPKNCRWATKEQQVRNMRKNRLITIDGKTMILKDWIVLLGKKGTGCFYYRKRKGMSDVEAILSIKNS